MTAWIANGFGHILCTPGSSTCQETPYAFHPEYSTPNVRGSTWSAHTRNIAMSDEIGHFENCLAIDPNANCVTPGFQDQNGSGFTITTRINNCNSGDLRNACPAGLVFGR
jgi:hypothetical protein